MRFSVLRPSSQLEKLRWAIKWAKDDVDLVLGGGKSRCGVSQLAIEKGTETQKRKLNKSSKHAFSGACLHFGCVCRLIWGNDWVLLVWVVFCVLDGRQNFLHQILLLPPSSTLESIISWVTRVKEAKVDEDDIADAEEVPTQQLDKTGRLGGCQ